MLNEAIILAGGLGKRMGNTGRPKWLTGIGDTTLAHLQLKWLARNGIQRVIVTMNKRYQDGFAYLPATIPITMVWEDVPIGDEGGLKGALEYLTGDEALVCNCDVLTELSLSDLPPAPALVIVHPRSPWGVLRDGTFIEKPLLTELWVSAGIYRLPKSIQGELAYEGEIARNIIPKLLGGGRLNILHYEGKWLAVETPKDIVECLQS